MKLSKTLAAAAFTACIFTLNANALESKIIATINNEIITDFDIKQMLESGASSKDEAFALLVQKQLIISLAKKFNITASPLEVQKALGEFLAANNTDEATFAKFSQAQKEHVQSQTRYEVLRKKLFDHIVANYNLKTITEDDVRKFFDDNLASKGADFEKEAPKIRAFLYNQAAQESLSSFMEREQAKAKVIIKAQYE